MDLVVDHQRIARRYPKCRGAYLDSATGIFLTGKDARPDRGKRLAFILLDQIYATKKETFGSSVPEDVLVADVVATIVHEVLHGFIRSGTRSRKRRDTREHRAMARLLLGVGLDPSW